MTTIIMRIWMRIFGIYVGSNFKCKGLFLIMKKRSANLIIGSNVFIKSSPFSNLLGLYQRTIIIARENGTVKIGNNVGLSGVTIHGTDISIGDHTAVGANTKIIDHDFHSLDYLERRTDDQTHAISKPIAIGEDVFIGCNSLILKGTRIGDRSIVGAGSVVTKDVEPWTIVGGNPAKVIRMRK